MSQLKPDSHFLERYLTDDGYRFISIVLTAYLHLCLSAMVCDGACAGVSSESSCYPTKRTYVHAIKTEHKNFPLHFYLNVRTSQSVEFHS